MNDLEYRIDEDFLLNDDLLSFLGRESLEDVSHSISHSPKDYVFPLFESTEDTSGSISQYNEDSSVSDEEIECVDFEATETPPCSRTHIITQLLDTIPEEHLIELQMKYGTFNSHTRRVKKKRLNKLHDAIILKGRRYASLKRETKKDRLIRYLHNVTPESRDIAILRLARMSTRMSFSLLDRSRMLNIYTDILLGCEITGVSTKMVEDTKIINRIKDRARLKEDYSLLNRLNEVVY